jgi:acyl carrier protein
MPKYVPQPVTWVGWLVQGLVVAAIIAFFWSAPKALYFVPLIVIGFLFESHRRKRRLQQMAKQRAGESICTFARSFDCSASDTWVIRAVYEQLQAYLSSDAPAFPLRREDDLVKELGIDSEELGLDLVDEIAARTGRSLENTENNPCWEKVETVGDLVQFFLHQPRTVG